MEFTKRILHRVVTFHFQSPSQTSIIDRT